MPKNKSIDISDSSVWDDSLIIKAYNDALAAIKNENIINSNENNTHAMKLNSPAHVKSNQAKGVLKNKNRCRNRSKKIPFSSEKSRVDYSNNTITNSSGGNPPSNDYAPGDVVISENNQDFEEGEIVQDRDSTKCGNPEIPNHSQPDLLVRENILKAFQMIFDKTAPPTDKERPIEEDSFMSMITSWYMSGYYTGYYKGLADSHKTSKL